MKRSSLFISTINYLENKFYHSGERNDTQRSNTHFPIVMLTVVILNPIRLSFIKLSAVMLRVVIFFKVCLSYGRSSSAVMVNVVRLIVATPSVVAPLDTAR